MKNKVLALFLLLTLCISIALPSLGAEYEPELLVDHADLLSNSEERTLLSMLENISERQQVNVAVVTLPYKIDLGGRYIATDIDSYASQYYDTYGYGYEGTDDGILLLVDMEEREWVILAVGYGEYAVTSDGYDWLEEEIVPYLSSGEYATAFTMFAEICDDLIILAKSGTPYDNSASVTSGSWILVCLLIGFVIACIVVGVMISKMKTVQRKHTASEYIKDGSFNLTHSQDIFLYNRLIKTPRDTGSSRSGSSGGRSSRSGKF